jgi:hypothetical protein
MTATTVRTGPTTSCNSAIGKNAFVKKDRLARIAYTYLPGNLCGVRCASCGKRAASAPHKLQSRKDRHHGNRRLQFIRGHASREQAAKHNPRNPT